MKSFKDTEGREWVVEVHVTAIKRVQGLLGLDLYALVDDGFKGLGELLAHPVKLVDVIYVLCKPQADERGITDEDFGRAMRGDAIGAAADAFLEEYVDFFRGPQRAALREVIAKARAVEAKVTSRLMGMIAAIDVDFEANRLSASSGSSPGSPGSIPDPSPSANSP